MNFLLKSKSSLSSLLSRCISNQIYPGIQQSRSSSYYVLHPQPKTQYYRFRRQPRWYHNPRNVVAVVLVSSAAGASIYYGNLETVPYTKRRHFVLISPSVERQLGEAQFNHLKNALRGKILSPIHPDSVRARLISNEIISALQRGLHHHEPHWKSIEYSSHEPSKEDFDPKRSPETILLLEDGCKEEHLKWPPEVEELMDDRWVKKSRDMDTLKGGTLPEMRHMEGLKWEVLVVRDKMVNAFCLPGGKLWFLPGCLIILEPMKRLLRCLVMRYIPNLFWKEESRSCILWMKALSENISNPAQSY